MHDGYDVDHHFKTKTCVAIVCKHGISINVLCPHTTRVSSRWQKSRRSPGVGRTKPYFSSNFFVFSTALSTTLVHLSRTADMMVSRRRSRRRCTFREVSILGYLYKMADRSYAPMTQGPFPSSANCPLRNYRGISSCGCILLGGSIRQRTCFLFGGSMRP